MSINKYIERIMRHPLYTIFIIEALSYYAKAVIAKGEPEENPRALISQKTWYNIAKDVDSEIKTLTGSKK